jgi:hypothetical protein
VIRHPPEGKGFFRGLHLLNAGSNALPSFFIARIISYFGSFHETAKVVNSLRISTAGITMKA